MERPRRQRLLCLNGPKGDAQCVNCSRSHYNHSLGCQFRVSSARALPPFSEIFVLILLVSAGATHPPCPQAPFKAMIRRGPRQKRIRHQMIPPASRRLVNRRQIRRRPLLPVHALGEVGSVQTGSLPSIPSQGSPYALHLSSTGSRCLARLSIAPTTVSCPQLKSWADPSSIS